MYYEKTELQGMIAKDECFGLTFDYFTTLIHKISKEGFFRFEIENYIIFGYKRIIPPKKYIIKHIM